MKRRDPNKPRLCAQELGKKKLILGITGSFGSGKTTVARMFGSFGAQIIDADKLAHRYISLESSAYKKIIDIFGKGILKKNRIIDRGKLARIAFNNKNLLLRLNNIIHPQVIRIIKSKIKLSRSKVVVLDAPLLLEAGLKKIVDKLIVVKITRVKQIKRIKNKPRTFFDGKVLRKYKKVRGKTSPSKADILKRIKYQIPLQRKIRLADFVIDNSGSIQKTKKQVERIRRLLWKN